MFREIMASLEIPKVVVSHLLPTVVTGVNMDESGRSFVHEWLVLPKHFSRLPAQRTNSTVCNRALKTFKIFSHPHPLPKAPFLPALMPRPHSVICTRDSCLPRPNGFAVTIIRQWDLVCNSHVWLNAWLLAGLWHHCQSSMETSCPTVWKCP